MNRVLLIILIISLSANIFAQENPSWEKEREKLLRDPAMLNQLANTFGVSPNDPKFQKLINNSQDFSESQELPEKPVIKHFIGQDGESFPSTEELDTSKLTPEQEKLIEEGQERVKKIIQEQYDQQLKELTTPTIFPACQAREKKVSTSGYSGQKDSAEIEFDYLFIKKSDLPKLDNDYNEIFGPSVAVIPITDQEIELQHMAKGFGVDCLPTRARATKEFLIYQYGASAVKNYSKDYYGKGELHHSMEKVFGRAD